MKITIAGKKSKPLVTSAKEIPPSQFFMGKLLGNTHSGLFLLGFDKNGLTLFEPPEYSGNPPSYAVTTWTGDCSDFEFLDYTPVTVTEIIVEEK